MSVAVIIPTYHRPDGLRAALDSVREQNRQPDEIIVVDNSRDASARPVCEALAEPGLRYVHEPRPGVANARNAALAATKARYIAFLDDDEIASPGWLAALLATAETLDAGIVFGPLQARSRAANGVKQHLLERLYSRPGPQADQHLDKPFGCGNSLIDRSGFEIGPAPFDPALNEVGGEDDAFFDDLLQQDTRMAWSAQAHALECVDPKRVSWPYLLARSFSYGQGPAQTCAREPKRNWAGVLGWMAVGCAQFAVFAPLAVLTGLTGAPRAGLFIDKAAQAAGKVFWFDRLAPRFYGESG